MNNAKQQLPRWDFSNVLPGIESPAYESAYQEVAGVIDDLEKYLDQHQISRERNNSRDDSSTLDAFTSDIIRQLVEAFQLVYTLRNYVYCLVTIDSYDEQVAQQYSRIQAQLVRLLQAEKVISGWLGSLGSSLDEIISKHPPAAAHAFYLRENADQSRFQMSDAQEDLANQLSLSGLRAWGNLQGTITSQLEIDFEMDGQVEVFPLPALQNIRRYNPDEGIRKRAFDAEIKALEGVREPLAACMNGVAGFNTVLNKARGREDAVHHSMDTARIDRETLSAMLGAMRESYPVFRKYLTKKAHRLGKNSLAWWDVFAPVGKNNRSFSWSEAREFVLDQFNTYSPELAAFAKKSFDNGWIDAEPRPGKRGGAFCIRIPALEEPRVLCNFDGSLDQVSTIAHELGHAYHIECQRGLDYLQYSTPMTLAETASIFCETIIMDAALENTSDPEEELNILETILVGDTQVIVDISSRYLFEEEVYKRRQESELSAQEFCDIITWAQGETYGDGLDENHRHPYMWAWKPHYYRADIAFYNYPYAFGLLFSTGLYALYKQRGEEFVPQLKNLLASTGQASAADLAKRFDIDIRSGEFWESSLQVIEARINRYLQL